jgi:hypothetical protein
MSTNLSGKGLSLARGFTVLIMPAVHTVLLYSSDAVKNGSLGKLLGFLAEGPGAQLFMYLMGVFIVLGRPKPISQILHRSCLLMFTGYLLNLVRFTLPFHMGIIPQKYLTDNGITVDASTGIQLLVVGDILQFASIAYLVCSLIYLMKIAYKGILVLLTLILLITPYAWNVHFNNEYLHQMVALFNGQPPFAFFPVFPWLIYPLLGLVMGHLYRREDLKHLLKRHIITGSGLMLTGYLVTLAEPTSWNTHFYRAGPGATLLHSGFVLVWIALFLLLANLIKRLPGTLLMQYLSRHITIIYIAQWIIILWLFPVFGYNRLDLAGSVKAIILTSSFSFVIPLLVQALRRKRM